MRLLQALVAAILTFASVECGAQTLSPPANAGEPRMVGAPAAFVGACARYAWLCADRPAAAWAPQGAALMKVANHVNRSVNHSIRPLSDPENYGTAEFWTLPTRGSGDCEDYALEKYRRLLDEGFASRDLRLAVVLDHNRNNHVVLVLRFRDSDLVLDSLTDRILPWNHTDYTYLAMQYGAEVDRWEVVMDRSRQTELLASR